MGISSVLVPLRTSLLAARCAALDPQTDYRSNPFTRLNELWEFRPIHPRRVVAINFPQDIKDGSFGAPAAIAPRYGGATLDMLDRAHSQRAGGCGCAQARHHDGLDRRPLMLQSTVPLMLNDETHPARDVGIAVIGLGAWGPNLLRVLRRRRRREGALDLRRRFVAFGEVPAPSSRRARDHAPRAHLGRSECRRRRPRDAGAHALRAGHARAAGRKARIRGDTSGDVRRAGRRPGSRGSGAALHPDVRSHASVQPAGPRGQAHDRNRHPR